MFQCKQFKSRYVLHLFVEKWGNKTEVHQSSLSVLGIKFCEKTHMQKTTQAWEDDTHPTLTINTYISAVWSTLGSINDFMIEHVEMGRT